MKTGADSILSCNCSNHILTVNLIVAAMIQSVIRNLIVFFKPYVTQKYCVHL